MTATETSVNIKPLADRVVLEVIDDSEQSAGGIYIPDSAREKPQQALVLAVGPGRSVDGRLEAMTVQVGDKVLFAKYAGTDVRLPNGREVKIVSEKDLLGILQG